MNLRRLALTFSPWAWLVIALATMTVAVVVWVIVTGPGRDRQAAATAKAGAAVAVGNSKAAHDAVVAVTDNAADVAATDDQTRKNADEIRSAPGASDPVGAGVDCAGRRAICLRHSARDLPACTELRRACP